MSQNKTRMSWGGMVLGIPMAASAPQWSSLGLPGALGCWWHSRAVAMQSCLVPCPGVTLPREVCQDWRRIPRGLQRAGSQAACLPVCLMGITEGTAPHTRVIHFLCPTAPTSQQ